MIENSEKLEAHIIGAIFLDHDFCKSEISNLTENDFLHPNLKEIFRAIKELEKNNSPIDVVTVSEKLKSFGHEENNFNSLIAQISSEVYSAANISEWVKLTKLNSSKNILSNSLRESLLQLETGADLSTILSIAQNGINDSLNRIDNNSRLKLIRDGLQPFIEKLKSLHDGKPIGLPTKLKFLDNYLGGLRGADLYILAGRPGTGKTALAFQIACMVAKDNCVLYESLEMNLEQLITRAVASESMVSGNRMETQTRSLTKNEWTDIENAMIRISKLNLWVSDHARVTVTDIRARAIKYKTNNKLKLIIIDYLQLMTPERQKGKGYNREQEISEISRGLKSLAMELNIPIIALSQLSREMEKENRAPRLSDLRESGSLEQDASVVLFTYRAKENIGKENIGKETMERDVILVAKNRHGALANINVDFNRNLTKFYGIDDKENFLESIK